MRTSVFAVLQSIFCLRFIISIWTLSKCPNIEAGNQRPVSLTTDVVVRIVQGWASRAFYAASGEERLSRGRHPAEQELDAICRIVGGARLHPAFRVTQRALGLEGERPGAGPSGLGLSLIHI